MQEEIQKLETTKSSILFEKVQKKKILKSSSKEKEISLINENERSTILDVNT